MQQVVFVEEVSLVMATPGRRPRTLPTSATHTNSISPLGTGAPAARTATAMTFVQCGLSTSERACSGFNYLSILFSTLLCKVENPKKNSKISPLAYVS